MKIIIQNIELGTVDVSTRLSPFKELMPSGRQTIGFIISMEDANIECIMTTTRKWKTPTPEGVAEEIKELISASCQQ